MFAACLRANLEAVFAEFPGEIRSLVGHLVCSPEFKRLNEISFLGAIDRFCGSQNGSGSRSDHSIGVAKLLLNFRTVSPFSEGEFRIALVHGLLHDIGHGPYSHSSEPFFKSVFGLDHHRMLVRIIENPRSPISTVLRGHGLWHDYRRFLKKPASLPLLHTLFSSPMNVDTIEGILRAARFFGIQSPVEVGEIVCALRRRTVSVKPLDRFWSLKGEVYNEHIFGDKHGHADRALIKALFSVRENLCEDDFTLTDAQLEHRLQRLNADISFDSPAGSERRQRHFAINDGVVPTRIQSLGSRYFEDRRNDEDHSGVQEVH